jgi:hypothetical protein
VEDDRYRMVRGGEETDVESYQENQTTRSGRRYAGTPGGAVRGRGMSNNRGRQVNGAGQGKRTLEERSPGIHTAEVRNSRQRVGTGSSGSEGDNEEEGMDMAEEQVEAGLGGAGLRDEVMNNGGGNVEPSTTRTARTGGNEEVGRNGRAESRRNGGGMDEWKLGELFTRLEEDAVKKVEVFIKGLPEEIREEVRKGMDIVMTEVKGVMSGISDAVASEG